MRPEKSASDQRDRHEHVRRSSRDARRATVRARCPRRRARRRGSGRRRRAARAPREPVPVARAQPGPSAGDVERPGVAVGVQVPDRPRATVGASTTASRATRRPDAPLGRLRPPREARRPRRSPRARATLLTAVAAVHAATVHALQRRARRSRAGRATCPRTRARTAARRCRRRVSEALDEAAHRAEHDRGHAGRERVGRPCLAHGRPTGTRSAAQASRRPEQAQRQDPVVPGHEP